MSFRHGRLLPQLVEGVRLKVVGNLAVGVSVVGVDVAEVAVKAGRRGDMRGVQLWFQRAMESRAITLLRVGSNCFRLQPQVDMTQRILGMGSKVRHGPGQLEGLSRAMEGKGRLEAAGFLRIGKC